MKPKQIKGVPEQQYGGSHDTESEKRFEPALLLSKFEILQNRFFSINQWQSYCGEGFADFRLYDHKGDLAERNPQKGDFIRIDIPGPGEKEAEGYDWVEVTDICFCEERNSESICMTCRPSEDPNNVKNDHITHFYSSKATSTFMISRTTENLTAAVYGRNESPNLNAELIDTVRNIFVAAGGMIGISKIQWKKLTDGLLDFD
ncbi:hypothetical protein ACKW6Q_19900 [Chryseobacterium kwangjuense]|uniref:Uncharacterized protein n=1 Tax=Chryseobacterium kwangjuense TaxID=267125 RepID=A0ABW9K9K2_9FLAO